MVIKSLLTIISRKIDKPVRIITDRGNKCYWSIDDESYDFWHEIPEDLTLEEMPEHIKNIYDKFKEGV